MLATLAQQDLLADDEVLVIDNNSNDQTKEVVALFEAQLPIRHVFEPKQGLSHARNTALKESSNNLVIFFDDDVFINKDVVKAYRNAISDHPNAGFMGGKISVAWPQEQAPAWWDSQDYALLNGLLINYDLGNQDSYYQADDRLPYGASFALRRDVIEAVGEFDINLGVSGSAIGRGEESDYFKRCVERDIKGVYLGAAHIQHRFEPHRLKLLYLFKYGVAKGRLNPRRNTFSSVGRLAAQAARGALQLARMRRGNFYQCMIMAGIHWGEMHSSR